MSHLNSACWCPSPGVGVDTFIRPGLAALVRVEGLKTHIGSQGNVTMGHFRGETLIGSLMHFFP